MANWADHNRLRCFFHKRINYVYGGMTKVNKSVSTCTNMANDKFELLTDPLTVVHLVRHALPCAKRGSVPWPSDVDTSNLAFKLSDLTVA